MNVDRIRYAEAAIWFFVVGRPFPTYVIGCRAGRPRYRHRVVPAFNCIAGGNPRSDDFHGGIRRKSDVHPFSEVWRIPKTAWGKLPACPPKLAASATRLRGFRKSGDFRYGTSRPGG